MPNYYYQANPVSFRSSPFFTRHSSTRVASGRNSTDLAVSAIFLSFGTRSKLQCLNNYYIYLLPLITEFDQSVRV